MLLLPRMNTRTPPGRRTAVGGPFSAPPSGVHSSQAWLATGSPLVPHRARRADGEDVIPVLGVRVHREPAGRGDRRVAGGDEPGEPDLHRVMADGRYRGCQLGARLRVACRGAVQGRTR